ncbi:MAG: hypothetical protein M1829_004259 [Trizodia sp. TS-e1964]|nr:MAG: hypothetical protein M1829_004259 [Trizodia sp. TS-e1964]
MAQEIRNVIVVGASGNLGSIVVWTLQSTQRFNVSVLTRSTSTAVFPQGVTVHKTDYSAASLLVALQGQDAVVSTIAGAALGEQKKVIDAAVQAGVKRFIPSEFGGNTANKYANDLVPVFARKVEVVNYLKAQSAASPSLTWTAIVTGPFFDRSLKSGVLGFDLQKKSAKIYDSGTRIFSTTTIATVGAAVVAVLYRPAETKNQYVYISSFNTTQTEILAALKKVAGGNWTTQQTTAYAEVLAYRESLAKGSPGAIRNMVMAATYTDGTGSNFAQDEKLSNSVLQLQPENLEAVIKSVLQT